MVTLQRFLLALAVATAWTDAIVIISDLSPTEGEQVVSNEGSVVLSANIRETRSYAKLLGAQFDVQEDGVAILEKTVSTATRQNVYALQIDGLSPGNQYCFRVKGLGQFVSDNYSRFSCFSIPGTATDAPDQSPSDVSNTVDTNTTNTNTTGQVPNIQYGLQEDCFRREPETFSICLDLSSESGAIEPWMTSFIAARERWESVITANGVDFPAFSASLDTRYTATGSYPDYIDGVYIASSVELIDGPGQPGRGNILGSAAPIFITQTSNGALPVVGIMRFDSFDIGGLVRNGLVDGVIEHEMGHVLGIGSLWQANDVYSGRVSAFDNLYKGANVAREWTSQGCELVDGFVPIVELDGGPGTRGGHFDERCFGDELMTGSVDFGMKLSRFTIASLEDIGYVVDYSQAANFTVPPQCCNPGAARRLNDPRRKNRRYHRKLSAESEEMVVEYARKELEQVQALRLELDENLDSIDVADVISVFIEQDGQIIDVEVGADGIIFI